MNINNINSLKNKDYIVLLPKCDYDIRESVEHSFSNVFYVDYELNQNEIKLLVDTINNDINQLIIFDYDDFYRLVLPHIKKEKKVKWIYKSNFASLTDGCVRTTFSSIMEFYDRDIVNLIGCLDYSSYEVLKNSNHKTKFIKLDIDKVKSIDCSSNSIGLIGNDFNPNHNIYNQLTAVKMIDYDSVKLVDNMPATRHFVDFFDINYVFVNNIDDAMKDNFVNLYCNFTCTNIQNILKSMDMGIPCLLGNTDIFDDYPKLKQYLILDSDDDVNEIAEKIKNIKLNREIILKEYEKFRKNYIKDSKELILDFINFSD